MAEAPSVSVADSLADIAAESLKLLIPVDSVADGIVPAGKYCAVMHAKLCRMKFLGLPDTAAAKAVAISPSALRDCREKYPKLACDMDSAVELANAHAAMVRPLTRVPQSAPNPGAGRPGRARPSTRSGVQEPSQS